MRQHPVESNSNTHCSDGVHTQQEDNIVQVHRSLPEQRDGEYSCQQRGDNNDQDYYLIPGIIVQ